MPPTRPPSSAFGCLADARPRARLSSAGRRSSRSRDDEKSLSSSFSRTVLRRKFSRSAAARRYRSRFSAASFLAAASGSDSAGAPFCGSGAGPSLASLLCELLMAKTVTQLLLRRLFKFVEKAPKVILGLLPGVLGLCPQVRRAAHRGGQCAAEVARKQPRDVLAQAEVAQASHDPGDQEVARV